MLNTFAKAAYIGSSLIIALISLRFLALPLAEVMDHMAHYLPQAPVALYGHILFAPLALILAPFQFMGRLRGRRPRLHRLLGYGYALSILIAGVSALALLPAFLGTTFAATGFAVLSVLWIGATARAILAARARDFATHRAWMFRSATLTFAAVTLRLMMAPLLSAGWSVVETYQITAWGAWLPYLILVELWLRSNRGARSRV